jgi:hypothetical protein
VDKGTHEATDIEDLICVEVREIEGLEGKLGSQEAIDFERVSWDARG